MLELIAIQSTAEHAIDPSRLVGWIDPETMSSPLGKNP
jgi:hypothetical protein